ncbi:hypothetical protein E2C01_090237 [Portunus trituberculatus]|uniref:Uncharacterized protein n=1 Tax=Portunus trituberculatus TaxID=210409 RepID=A0A5B7JKV9_PORTR|nr:hypothetical protein [Portunus trituberculatus]
MDGGNAGYVDNVGVGVGEERAEGRWKVGNTEAQQLAGRATNQNTRGPQQHLSRHYKKEGRHNIQDKFNPSLPFTFNLVTIWCFYTVSETHMGIEIVKTQNH